MCEEQDANPVYRRSTRADTARRSLRETARSVCRPARPASFSARESLPHWLSAGEGACERVSWQGTWAGWSESRTPPTRTPVLVVGRPAACAGGAPGAHAPVAAATAIAGSDRGARRDGDAASWLEVGRTERDRDARNWAVKPPQPPGPWRRRAAL